MVEGLSDRLRQKGWAEHEIKKTERIIQQHKVLDKSGSRKELNRLLYWMSLLVLVICNLLVAVFLVPFLLILEDVVVYFIIGVLGLVFGLFFNLLIQDIEHLEKHHHFIAAILMPLISIINIFIMVRVSGRIAGFLQIEITKSPAISSLIYVWVFLMPYIYTEVKKWKRAASGI